MNLMAFDVECSILNNGDPYHPDNRLVEIGFYDNTTYQTYYKQEIGPLWLESIEKALHNNTVVGHNLKFDFAWMNRIGIDTRQLSVFDTQLAEFLITNQTKAFASLNELAEKYLGEHKIDRIKTEYWEKGIDTWFIPEDELTEYLKQDLALTYKVAEKQMKILKETGKWKLFRLQCADLCVLNDMEWNGIPFDKEESIKSGEELSTEINRCYKSILKYTECPSFNPSSNDHISCLLYGGSITHEYRVPVGVYKSGAKMGQPRNKVFTEIYEQPRLVDPIKGSELKKEGYWSTDEYTLSSLKPRSKEIKELIDNILELSKLEKLQKTYYFGIPKLMDEKKWENNLLHGRFNQCVARTGRLSASEPNQQNFDPRLKELCRSSYE